MIKSNYEKDQKYLAIDIGSNAMRAVYGILDKNSDLDIIDNLRFPLRLGEDVFKGKKISSHKFELTLNAFSQICEFIERNDIQQVKAIATSAIRDSKNGHKLIELIRSKYDISVKIINGQEEAKIISKAILSNYTHITQKALLIDIGGGSTEITLMESDQVLYSKSFQTGTLRLLQLETVKKIQEEAKSFINKLYQELEENNLLEGIETCIGSGGNLRRMGKLRKTFFNRSPSKLFQSELIAINLEVKKLSLDQRINFLSMRRDRADVIIPAMCLIEELLIKFDQSEIFLPRVGLKEGLLLDMIKDPVRYIFY